MGKIQLKKNDIVVVRKGKDKGKTGKILKLFPETNRVIVERINFTKHFVRADRSKNVQGGIMEKETPIHVSNVMLFCAECGQGVRARVRRLEDGTKTRICGKCEALIEAEK
jgi:large subunit ribosomal protein L24